MVIHNLNGRHMMKLSFQRLDDILNYLITQSSPVTLDALSKLTKVSGRTVRSDIKSINELISKQGAEVFLIRKKGYLLSYHNKKIFEDFWNNKDTGTFLFTSSESRIQYLLRLFLTSDSFITQDFLLSVLFVSTNTLYNDFRTVKHLLADYQLSIVNKSNLGYRLEGEEIDIRMAINQLIFQENLTDFITASNTREKDLCLNIDFQKFSFFFEKYLNKIVQKDSDYFHKNAFSGILLSFSRIKEKKIINNFDLNPSLKEKVKKAILDFLRASEDEFKIVIPEVERRYIIYLLTENFPNLLFDNNNKENMLLAKQIVSDVTFDLFQLTKSRWTLDEGLKLSLIDHFNRLLNIHQIKSTRNNPILDVVKNDFPYPFELAISQVQKIEKRYDISLTEDEVSYIALYFASAIENSNDNVLTIAVVCGTGKILSSIIEGRIRKKFPYTFSEIKKLSYLEYEELENKNKYQIVVTTIQNKNLAQKNVIFFDNSNLNKSFKNIEKRIKEINLITISNRHFNPSHFMVIEEKKSKETVLEEISNILYKDKSVTVDFFNDLLAREELSSTVINDSIALPHPLNDSVIKSTIFVAVVPRGLEWDENTNVKFIFLLAIKSNEVEELQNVYDTLLDFIYSNDKQESLIKNPNYNNLLNIFT